jgi:hypothetical protein
MKEWFATASQILVAGGALWAIIQYFLNKGRKRAIVDISKVERESGKFQAERYLVELNVSELIDKKAQIIEEKYKDIIFNMQREHFEIKKDIQGRLEKEMKARIEAEQENEILKNELNIIKEKSEDQDRKSADQDKQIKQLQKEVNELKNHKTS